MAPLAPTSQVGRGDATRGGTGHRDQHDFGDGDKYIPPVPSGSGTCALTLTKGVAPPTGAREAQNHGSLEPTHGRTTSLTAEQRAARAPKAGKVAQTPQNARKRLVKDWPALTPEPQSQIRSLLRPVHRGRNG